MDAPEHHPIPKTLEAAHLIKPSDLEPLEVTPFEPKHVVEGLTRHRKDLEHAQGHSTILPFFDIYDSTGNFKGSTGSVESSSQLNRINSALPGDILVVDISTPKSPEELSHRQQIIPDKQSLDQLPDRNLRWIEGQNMASEHETTLHIFRVTPDHKLQPLRIADPQQPTNQ